MSAMYRLKAYFGMVPAEEMDYADEPDTFADPRRARVRDRWADPDDRYEDSDDYAEYGSARQARVPVPEERPADEWSRRSARESVRPARPVRTTGTVTAGLSSGLTPTTRGALAVDREEPVLRPAPEPVAPAAPPVPVAPAPSLPEQRDRASAAPAAITTLQPSSFTEARTIGERYRDGVPVIMNLTDLDEAAARRLVDFAAGLAFALRGSIDKVTSRVFLLTPADVEVSADDARRLAERGLFRQD
jgi:cell division inhibitor SepF